MAGNRQNRERDNIAGRPEFDGFEWCYTEETSIEGEYGNIEYSMDLPDGTIEKILGRKLTYEESPVEIK